MDLLALDFDGVIFHSAREVYVVALRTYADLNPRSRLIGPLESLGPGRPLQAYDFPADPLLQAFENLVPLGNRAEDFGVAFLTLEQQEAIPDQAASSKPDTVKVSIRKLAFCRIFA